MKSRSGSFVVMVMLLALLAAASVCAQVTNVYQNGVGGYAGTEAVSISTQDPEDTGGNGLTGTVADPFGDGELPFG